MALRCAALAATLAIVGGAAASTPAEAEFGVQSGTFAPQMTGADATVAGKAGDLVFGWAMNKGSFLNPEEIDGAMRNVFLDFPRGVIANPTGFPICRMVDVNKTISTCPRESAVGYMRVKLAPIDNPNPATWTTQVRIFRVQTQGDEAAAFGVRIANLYLVRMAAITTPERGNQIRTTLRNLNAAQPVGEIETVLWGLPAEHQAQGGPLGVGSNSFGNPMPASTERHRFLTVPTRCEGQPLRFGLALDPWSPLNAPFSTSADIPFPSGCDQLPFNPSIEVTPEHRKAGQPAGYTVEMEVPQNEDPVDGLETPNLKDAVVTMPRGVSISPPQAEGLEACTDAQIALKANSAPECPAASKIGEFVIDTPLLEYPVPGNVFLGSQQSNDPLSGDMYRIFIAGWAPGVRVKQEGRIQADPVTGQLTTTFPDNPELPFSKFTLNFKGGDRAPLVNPSSCGTHTATTTLTPWGGPVARPTAEFTIDEGCGTGQLTPGFSAGTTNPIGGAYSPFTLRVTRPDGQQNVSTIQTTLPEGVLAKLAGVPLCGGADAATGNCPASSRVGSATVGVGAGASPLYVPQPGRPAPAAYLAGPYKGAPYSLVVKVPAQAGPFDLGTVTVRNTIEVDPVTAQVSVKSDPLPQILAGIPIAYRDIRVNVDRADFTLNPTSCDPMEVKGTIRSANGQGANVSDRFQVADCGSLDFSPHLKLKVSGPTKRGTYPKLRAELNALPGQANIDRASVALPHSMFLAQEHIKTICTRVQYAAKQCPEGSVYGWARAFTPLLDQPLEGPVYLRSSSNPLPDLVASLDGAIHVDLAGRIDSVNGGIRTTFEGVPDAPVSKFVLSMQGGKKSLLVNSRNLCAGVNRATVQMDGQNGRAHDFRPAVGNSCGKAKKKRAGKHRTK